ncbi:MULTISPECIES: hypothetical protein [Streptomyces]|uniref:Uncharacterized protein n=1 Tax=Streptomyces canarius TaxID=285453 RepID=A0ABQ3D2H4_9ACTN|nr:hypothetical protein [Streptomyces canarius]GHA55232.1 hypothetical protein GCM10010345_69810 [Streptomyces canarius]
MLGRFGRRMATAGLIGLALAGVTATSASASSQTLFIKPFGPGGGIACAVAAHQEPGTYCVWIAGDGWWLAQG